MTFLKENPNRGIAYHGILKRDEMPAVLSVYGGSLIPLIKNIYGAVPSKIYEAMASGLPILFSGEGEGAKIIKRVEAGWVNDPRNWEQIKRNISLFLEMDQNEFMQLRENNRKVASLQFDRNKQIEALSRFLEERMN
jgi:glycosyltransferase involved in cell wall biosynthesis